MKNKKALFWLFGMLIVFTVMIFSFSTTYAQNGVVLPQDTGLSSASVKEILTKLLIWLLEIVGVIAIIGFVISGIMYLVSTGNDEMITKAKTYMTYCLVGVIVVLASFVVIRAIDAILKASGSY